MEHRRAKPCLFLFKASQSSPSRLKAGRGGRVSFFSRDLFYFMYMFSPICVHMYHVCAWCPLGQKRASGTGVMGGLNHHVGEPGSSARAVNDLTTELSLWSIPLSFVLFLILWMEFRASCILGKSCAS